MKHCSHSELRQITAWCGVRKVQMAACVKCGYYIDTEEWDTTTTTDQMYKDELLERLGGPSLLSPLGDGLPAQALGGSHELRDHMV